MGLDMYAFRVAIDAERPIPGADARLTSEDIRYDEDGTPLFKIKEELHYWRKHPDLHGWMGLLYRAKGGTDPAFNCNTVRISAEDLDALEIAVNAGSLPPTSGFFFGQSDPDRWEDDLDFIRKARKVIADGDAVYYTSWW